VVTEQFPLCVKCCVSACVESVVCVCVENDTSVITKAPQSVGCSWASDCMCT